MFVLVTDVRNANKLVFFLVGDGFCAAWWYKPEYMINELNINSVITTPGHDEVLPINALTTQRPYTIKGYAYSGESAFHHPILHHPCRRLMGIFRRRNLNLV